MSDVSAVLLQTAFKTMCLITILLSKLYEALCQKWCNGMFTDHSNYRQHCAQRKAPVI